MTGKKLQKGGTNGYGFFGGDPRTPYVECGIVPTPENIQTGGNYTVNHYNQIRGDYGFTGGENTRLYGGFYAPYSTTEQSGCTQLGGKRHKTKKHKKSKSRKRKRDKSRKHKKSKSRKHKKSKSRKHKKSKSRKHKKKQMRARKQQGGYAQYSSNQPLTWTQQSPNGQNNWQLSTPTYSKSNNCNDNYNHFTGKGESSPILD